MRARSMMQQLSMNPQAIQNLIDPNDSKQQMIFSGIQNLAEQFSANNAGGVMQMPSRPFVPMQ